MEWTCVATCDEQDSYVLVRQISSWPDYQMHCKGPATSTCTFFTDPNCTALVGGQLEPDFINESGASCNQSESGPQPWCSAAGKPFDYNTRFAAEQFGCNYMRYTCIKPCNPPNSRQEYVNVWLAPDGTVSCVGNRSSGDCIWWEYASCLPMQGNGSAIYSDPWSPTCADESSGWCKDAAEMLRNGRSPSCTTNSMFTASATRIATSTVTTESARTPIPSSAVRPRIGAFIYALCCILCICFV